MSVVAVLQKSEDKRFFLDCVFTLSFSLPNGVAFVQLALATEDFIGFVGCLKDDGLVEPLEAMGCRRFLRPSNSQALRVVLTKK